MVIAPPLIIRYKPPVVFTRFQLPHLYESAYYTNVMPVNSYAGTWQLLKESAHDLQKY